MDREKAIEIIRKELLCVDRDTCKREECKSCDLVMPSKEPIIEAYKMAIKALEQEHILDKIRAEIMELDYDIETIGFDLNDMPQTEMIHTVCREEVLRIIDKHKKESEDK